jgi:hypothetical protein
LEMVTITWRHYAHSLFAGVNVMGAVRV